MSYTINPLTWFRARELSNTPKHFVLAKTPLTAESYQWIADTLSGRYSLVEYIEPEDNGYVLHTSYLRSDLFGQVAFEDHQDAVIYELRWS